jgi:hypothetical protein
MRADQTVRESVGVAKTGRIEWCGRNQNNSAFQAKYGRGALDFFLTNGGHVRVVHWGGTLGLMSFNLEQFLNLTSGVKLGWREYMTI